MALAGVRREFRRWRIARAIREARSRGHGLYSHEWDQSPGSVEGLSHDILEWCRHTLALCRRPFGIDHFDLTLTIEEAGASRTHRMGFLRPGQLYGEAALPDELNQVLLRETSGRQGPVRVIASLLSWGDVAYVAMPSS